VFENKISFQSIARKPRGIVTINGISANFIKAQVNSTTNFLADTFSLELPISGQNPQLSQQYFSSESAIMAQIYVGFPANVNNYTKDQLTSLIEGQVDEVEIDFVNRKYILTGRDLTAKFIDNKTTNKFPNLTSSQIVQKFAKEQGLSSDVTPTNTLAGVYYAGDRAAMTAELPEWDLITFLSQQENFIAYIEGTTLHFHPAPSQNDTPYLIRYNQALNDGEAAYTSFNGISLNAFRSLTVARDVIVIVRSWNNASKKAFNVRVRRTPNKKTFLASQAQPIGDAQVYTYTKPGLSKEQALNLAQQYLREKSQHERKIEAEIIPDVSLKKTSVIKLSGTNTDFDQIYFTYSINREITPTDFRMVIEAKNHSPNSEVIF